MNNFEWEYFILGLIAYQLLKILALSINQMIINRRKQRFLKLVTVKVPDQTKIAFVAVDASDKRAMAKLERQLREEFDLDEVDIDDHDFNELLRR